MPFSEALDASKGTQILVSKEQGDLRVLEQMFEMVKFVL